MSGETIGTAAGHAKGRTAKVGLVYSSEHLHKPENGPTLERINLFSMMIESRELQIRAALRHAPGTHTFDDVVAMAMRGRVILWVFGDSFAMLEVIEYPRKKSLHVFLGGGVLSDLVAMRPALTQKAIDLGCDMLTVSGRPGWPKVMKSHGWKHMHSTIWHEVDQEVPSGRRRS